MKQRLVGAAVLVALAVIFLPMLVDGPEPPAGATTVPLDIPVPPERDFDTRELPLTPTTPAATPSVQTDPELVVAVDADNAPRVDAMPETDAITSPEQPGTPELATTSPTPAPVDATTNVDKTASAAPELPEAVASGQFAVNLGSYANAANATGLARSLKAAGLPAYTDAINLDGKPGLRVRIGPYAQRGEAEAARLAAARVRKDVPAAVVTIEPDGDGTTGASRAPVWPAVAPGFAVQIGALSAESDAVQLRDRAQRAGFVAFVERTSTDGGVLWRVRVGPELQRANADKLKVSIKQKLQLDGMVVSYP